MGKVPDDTKEVINGSYFRAYIRTTENKVLSCSFANQNECWISDVNPTDSIAEACNSEHVAFSPAIHPPANSVSCVFSRTGYGETAEDSIYLIDQDHNLWRWLLVRSGGETPAALMMMVAGGLAGALVGSIVWIMVTLFRKKKIL